MTYFQFPIWEPKKIPFGIVSEDMVKIRIAATRIANPLET